MYLPTAGKDNEALPDPREAEASLTAAGVTKAAAKLCDNEPTVENEEDYILDQNRFPDKIRLLLDENVAPEAMWWLPEGNAVLVNKEAFCQQLLIKHFRGNKFTSVTRNFNRWYVILLIC